MAARPVEWVLVVFYGKAAHQATYGRFSGTTYTKDYIQLSRKPDFLSALSQVFPAAASNPDAVSIAYRWPSGSAPGKLIMHSADRPHLAWETKAGAPDAWRMALTPDETTAETIPGDPTQQDSAAADNEFDQLSIRGAGQPYLVAVKLYNEPATLHLRAYLAGPDPAFSWADIGLMPNDIQTLAAKTSQNAALEWSKFKSGGAEPSDEVLDAVSSLNASENIDTVTDGLDATSGRALARYLEKPAYGLFFDPDKNHDAWLEPEQLSPELKAEASALAAELKDRFQDIPNGDAIAESLEFVEEEVDAFTSKIDHADFEVPDNHATMKTRGSAQKAFADKVKKNYGFRCAVTGIATKDFLVAAHIVPWSKDPKIRLDPSNGICLSLLIDRAYENGYLIIEDDLTIRIDFEKIGDDGELESQLKAFDGQKIDAPSADTPRPDYLQRRRELTLSSD